MGRPKEYAAESTRTSNPKRILVIGNGPSAIEAARVAQKRGHDVTLMSKAHELNGHWATYVRGWVTSRRRAFEQIGGKIELGVKITPELLHLHVPNTVVVQDEVRPRFPAFAIGKGNVFTVDQVLTGGSAITGRTVIVGGTSAGCQAAKYLARKGAPVTIVDKSGTIGHDIQLLVRPLVIEKLEELGVRMMPLVEAIGLEGAQLLLATKNGGVKTIRADNVVLAVGYEVDQSLLIGLRATLPFAFLSVPHSEAPNMMPRMAEAGAAVAYLI